MLLGGPASWELMRQGIGLACHCPLRQVQGSFLPFRLPP